MISGVISVDKPKDWTSFDVVNYIRKLLKSVSGTKQKLKVGHLGTLDPMATGVLLVTINKATKLFDLMQQKIKKYKASFKFGVLTDSLDSTGKEINSTHNIPTLEQINEIIPLFIGEIAQVPPIFSAKSVNGERAYNLARQGVEFELPAKTVNIYNIEVLDYKDKTLTLNIECGSGTYIRSIGRDIAEKLNTFATMTSLVRTSIDNFSLSNSCKVEELSTETVLDKIIPINKFLNYPIISVDEIDIQKLLNGMTIKTNNLANGLCKLNKDDNTVALVNVEKNLAKMTIYLD